MFNVNTNPFPRPNLYFHKDWDVPKKDPIIRSTVVLQVLHMLNCIFTVIQCSALYVPGKQFQKGI